MSRFDRRLFLRGGLRAAAYGGVMAAFGRLAVRSAQGMSVRPDCLRGYGLLYPTLDETTGLPLLRLPKGFRYQSFGWRNDMMGDGILTPASHDGMGVVDTVGDQVILIRNHEISGARPPFAAPAYDGMAGGGTTTLVFDRAAEEWVGSSASLSGTVRNCAGGPTPWGSWLSGEETNSSPGGGLLESHGWVFEVPGQAPASAVPLTAMGRFSHEAVAVDPATGVVYQTEDDRYTSGFYRFLPNTPNQVYGLEDGGQLQALKVVGVNNANLQPAAIGSTYAVEWVTIADPTDGPHTGVGPWGAFDGQTTSASGPFFQADQLGAARFRRLEGCWYSDGVIYFVDTEGGRRTVDTDDPEGTVWCYDPTSEKIRVVFESPAAAVLDNPDNMTVRPGGGILFCEDNNRFGNRVQGLTLDGEIVPLIENNVVLNGQVNGFVGDFRDREWAGATFDPSGTWLFVNIQTPGITFAITGPWESGPL